MNIKELIAEHKHFGINDWKHGMRLTWYLFCNGHLMVHFHKKWMFGFDGTFYDGFLYALQLGFVTINLYEHDYGGRIYEKRK